MIKVGFRTNLDKFKRYMGWHDLPFRPMEGDLIDIETVDGVLQLEVCAISYTIPPSVVFDMVVELCIPKRYSGEASSKFVIDNYYE